MDNVTIIRIVAGVLAVVMLVLYFLPYMLARKRGSTAKAGIFVLNLFLGWTFIGWLAALIWAVSGETQREAKAKLLDYGKLAESMRAQTEREP